MIIPDDILAQAKTPGPRSRTRSRFTAAREPAASPSMQDRLRLPLGNSDALDPLSRPTTQPRAQYGSVDLLESKK
jgi:hypothetical protein